MKEVANSVIDNTWSEMKGYVSYLPRDLVLEAAVRHSHLISGNIIEFGVAEGNSTRALNGILTKLQRTQFMGEKKKIFACDSFQGLPEKFENADVGTFACKPPIIPGVEIVVGYFEKSLTPELAKKVEKVSLASLDADLFSSTLCALRWLTNLVDTGSILLFDEFLGENESEKKAFDQWSQETGIRTEKIAEFSREPSGWGKKLDKRVLFQVVGKSKIKQRKIATLGALIKLPVSNIKKYLKKVRG